MPPELGWEQPLWELYVSMQRQWRTSEIVLDKKVVRQRVSLDYNAFIPVIKNNHWDMEVSLGLLSAIEDAYLVERRLDS